MRNQGGKLATTILLILPVIMTGCSSGTGFLSLSFFDFFPPTIEATVAPPPNSAGWHNSEATVTFTCADRFSGVAECPDPVVISTETAATTVTGTATDRRGNTADASVVIKLDMTRPRVAITWPPVDFFNTDLAIVNIAGSVDDSLSGVVSSRLTDINGMSTPGFPEFDVEAALRTAIPGGQDSVTTELSLGFTDAAGNAIDGPISVRHVDGAHILPGQIGAAENVDGVLIAIDRAMVTFQPNVGRDTAESLLRTESGHGVGFFPSQNIVVADFDTATAGELQVVLQRLRNDPNVRNAVPGMFQELIARDDNLDLADGTSSARGPSDTFEGMLLAEARGLVKRWVELDDLPLAPVTIALIDSGLDPTFGNNEFSGDVAHEQIDLCDPRLNLAPDDLVGHGTQVSGVVAAANNGVGMNGVVSGLEGSEFRVLHLRVVCEQDTEDLNQNGLTDDWLVDQTLIMAALDRIVAGDFGPVHVINASFASPVCHTQSGMNIPPGVPARVCTQGDFALGQAYADYFDSVAGRNMLIVAGAGNDGILSIGCEVNDFMVWPARLACDLPNVISVGGLEVRRAPDNVPDAGEPRLFRDNFVNNGMATTIKAPSQNVWTTIAPNDYGYVGGTSLAAPFVSGLAGLALSLDPTVTPDLLKLWVPEMASTVSQTLSTITVDGLNIRDALIAVQGSNFTLSSISNSPAFVPVHSIDQPGLAGFEVILEAAGVDERIRALGFQFPQANQLRVEYDLEQAGNYFWNIDRRVLPAGSMMQSATLTANGVPQAQGTFVQPAETVPVLTGFRISGAEYRRLRTFTVDLVSSPGGVGEILVTWADDSPVNDSFTATIDYALVPAIDIGPSQELVATVDWNASAFADIPATRPVLQGFELQFVGQESEVDEIAVRLRPGEIRLRFKDGDNESLFRWRVKWAAL